MEAALSIFKLSFLLSLLSGGSDFIDSRSQPGQVGTIPPSCIRVECPSYELVYAGNGYEIHRYNATVWISTEPIQGSSLNEASGTGWNELSDYMSGNNEYHQRIERILPYITQVSQNLSTFMVSFFVPKEYQPDPPPPVNNLHVQRWDPTYAAVKQFGGYVADHTIGNKVAELEASLQGTVWAKAIEKSRETGSNWAYTVAQFSWPFQWDRRVNEIWFPFEMDDEEIVNIVTQ
ncbi:PREDICTED: heme-binding protein 2 [Camelina sativa]|uniref:Heme-binding protein 2 n=1 Tax=Camelina sativa TaxID=90675 RepID=A0ABM0SVQ6_CAMSA|nr:PREDICTED: heme-binding protein 2 [Camelina sativa]